MRCIGKGHKHQIAYTVLIVVILLLLSRGKQGRYAIASYGQHGAYVIDTKTSKVWSRTKGASVYLGTNNNPRFEVITGNPKDILKAKDELDEYQMDIYE